MYTCCTGLYRLPCRIEIVRAKIGPNEIFFSMQIDSLIDSRALRSKADTVEIIRALIHGGSDFSNFTSLKNFVFSFPKSYKSSFAHSNNHVLQYFQGLLRNRLEAVKGACMFSSIVLISSKVAIWGSKIASRIGGRIDDGGIFKYLPFTDFRLHNGCGTSKKY